MFLEKAMKAYRYARAVITSSYLDAHAAITARWNRHIASRWAVAVDTIQTAWMKHVEGPYVTLHRKSRAFRIFAQAGSVLGVSIAAIIGFVGVVFGAGGAGGITLALIGADSPYGFGVAALLLGVGMTIITTAAGLGLLAVKLMNDMTKQTILGATLAFMGLYMAWFGLGVLGILGAMNLDPFGVFQYAGAEGVDAFIMVLMVVAGTLCAAFGIGTLPLPQLMRALAFARKM